MIASYAKYVISADPVARFPLLASVIAVLLVAVSSPRVDGAVYVVTSANDSGEGSLREAIGMANATADADTIVFELPAQDSRTIQLSSALPALSGTLSIINDRVGDRVVTVQRSSAAGTPLFRIIDIAYPSTIVLTGLTLSNGALPNGPYFGAGIFNNSSDLTLRRCTITGNVTEYNGGGIAQFNGSLEATECVISNNSAAQGGGVYLTSARRTTLTNCTISNNTATASAGGGILNSGHWTPQGQTGELRITNCTISGNSVRDFGGGLANYVNRPDLVSVVSSTITANTAGRNGGGICRSGGESTPNLTLANTIIAGNSAASGYDGHDLWGEFASGGHNILGRETTNIAGGGTTSGLFNGQKGDQVGTSGAPLNARLGPLQMNGGGSATHAPLAGSPAIDKGDAAAAPHRDQRGYSRVGMADVGAVEHGGAYPRPLLNISTRGQVAGQTEPLIGGLIITGTVPKRVVVRACGPSLAVAGGLGNPRLELRTASGDLLVANDDWKQAANHAEITDSMLAPNHDAESAILTTLEPGAYTALVRGVNGTSGVALVEAYDIGSGAEARLANISTRGLVSTGDDAMIGGFIVGGSASERVLIRAIGPSLPLDGRLSDPTPELVDQHGSALAFNDNWRDWQEAQIRGTGIPPSEDREAAVLSVVNAGAYTAVVRGAGAASGVALVELYALE